MRFRVVAIVWTLVAASLALAQTAPAGGKDKTPKDEPWRQELVAFASSVVVIAEKCERPEYFQLLESIRSRAIISEKDKPVWVLLRKLYDKELHGELAKAFSGKVSWTGKVKSVEADRKEGVCIVQLEFPTPKAMPKGLEFLDTLYLAIPFGRLPPQQLPVKGASFAFTGDLKKANEDDWFEPVCVRYGVGPNLGKTLISVHLINVSPTTK